MTLRIDELVIDGLRGCPTRFVLRLRGKSLCLVGENGHAKTTVADAAELWSTGDLAAFHREGCPLAAAIHLDASRATIELSNRRFGTQSRTLDETGVGELELLGPTGSSRLGTSAIPILRHSTLADFMSQTAGEKRKALLSLLGLDDLNGLREPLKTSANRAKRERDAARRQLDAERAAVESQLAGEELVAYSEERRVRARLEQPIAQPRDILGLNLSSPPAAGPDRAALVDRLAGALTGVGHDVSVRWNREIADENTLRADGMAALLSAAQRVLAPTDVECPVCEQPVVGEQLAERLAERAASLEAVRARLAEAADELGAFEAQIAAVAAALAEVQRAAPASGWPGGDALDAASEALAAHRRALRVARDERRACPPAPDLEPLRVLLASLRKVASDHEGTAQARALVDLVELRQKCLRLADAQRRGTAAEQAHAAVGRILAIADEEIEQAITEAIGSVGTLAADYYARLVRHSPFTDVSLVYRAARAGQVEFSLTFDGRHSDVSPPQRVMSTSQLNALGLALHLARLKLDAQPWRTLILDDVVNSFDATHRQGLTRLLIEEFNDWQVILLTHDRAFKDILSRMTKGWEFKEIVAYSPRLGPQLSDGNPRAALRERLDAGATAMEVAQYARRALESGLSGPLAQLGYEIRYDPNQRYTASDYLRALRRGFKHRASGLKDLPVLARMEVDTYLSNLGVHERRDSTALTTDDLYRLVDDLAELEAALYCRSCAEPVWGQRRNKGGKDHFRCACGALAA